MRIKSVSYPIFIAVSLLLSFGTNAIEINKYNLNEAKNLIEIDRKYEALNILVPLAELNNAEAQNLIGEIYHFGGKDIQVDYQKAYLWYQRAFENGSGQAANHLGRIYLNGEGRPSNPKIAEYWYYQSSLKGDKEGEMNYYSLINPAISYTLEQAHNGHSEAQVIMGTSYHFGAYGIPINYDKARYWYLKASSQGNHSADQSLGRMYLNGEGVIKNLKEAEKWYEKAKKELKYSLQK